MIGTDLADPVLAVDAGNLVHRDRVVIEAETIGGEPVQTLIDDAGAGVDYSFVVDRISDTESWLEILRVRCVQVFLRILRCIEEHDSAGRSLSQPPGLRQGSQSRSRGRDLAPIPI